MNPKSTSVQFDHFLEKFPELDLPITLGEETHHHFSNQNDPLPGLMIEQFLAPLESNVDEFTEFIACFRFIDTKNFHALVYWKAGLMDYTYTLVTFTTKGLVIDKRVIAGTFSDGKVLTQSVATIDEDWGILIASGQSSSNENEYDASSSTAYNLELLPDGKIVNI